MQMVQAPAGTELTAVAMNWEQFPSILPRGVTETLKSLQLSVGEIFSKKGNDCPREILEIQACLERLEAFLFQSTRLYSYLDLERLFSLPETVKTDVPDISSVPTLHELPAGSGFAVAAANACTDFESFLFHGRALLDRFALCVDRHHGNDTDKFSRLEGRLAEYSKADPRAKKLSQMLRMNNEGLVGPITDPNGKRSLRSLLAHRSSFAEGTRVVFYALRLEDERFLVFDCEVAGYPVFGTFRRIFKLVPFVVVGGLLIYMRAENLPQLADFEPDWEVPFVNLSDYKSEQAVGHPIVFPVRFRPSQIVAGSVYVDRSIFERAVAIPPANAAL